jgi:4-amino-4-deoxy-L-arabinose transferase-like glycosyltransferase
MRNPWRAVAPAIAAAALRLIFLAAALWHGGAGALIQPDTGSYLRPGINLLLHGQFASSGLPELDRTPGYPLFLALFGCAGPLAVVLTQILLSAVSVILVWRIARVLYTDERVALAAAWIFAFEPLAAVYSVVLLSETLFLFLFLFALDLLVVFLSSNSLRALAFSGLSLAAAAYVRPIAYYLPLVLAAGLLIALRRDPGLRWKAPAVLLLCSLPFLAAWQARNYAETGFAGFSSVQPQDLFYYNAGEVTARLQHRPLTQVDRDLGYGSDALLFAHHPEAATWSRAQRLAFMRSDALRVLAANPLLFLRTHAAGMLRTAFNPGAAVLVGLFGAPVDSRVYNGELDLGPFRAARQAVRNFPVQAAVMALLALILFALYALALRGLLRRRLPAVFLCLLVGVAFYFLVLSGGAVGAARLRLPYMPIVCILAAAGLVRPPRPHPRCPS